MPSTEFKITLNRFKKKVEEIIKRDNAPSICFDLDETLTVLFGGPLAQGVVELLSKLAESGVSFGINTGADIGWFGQRVLRITEEFFHWPFNGIGQFFRNSYWQLYFYRRLSPRNTRVR